MAKRGHCPRRTCLGCGERDSKANMVRLVVKPSVELATAKTGGGRGGYLHRDGKCYQAFIKRKSVYRAFHQEISRDAKESVIRELEITEIE